MQPTSAAPPVPKPTNLSETPKLLAKSVTRQTPSPSFKIIFGCFDFNSVRMIAFISALIIDKDDQDDRWTCQMIKQDEQDDQNENGRRTWQQARGRRSGQPAPRGWVQGTWNGTLPNSYVQGAQISDVFLLPKCITLSWWWETMFCQENHILNQSFMDKPCCAISQVKVPKKDAKEFFLARTNWGNVVDKTFCECGL